MTPRRNEMVTKPTGRSHFAGIDRNDGEVKFPGWFRDLMDAPAGQIQRPAFLPVVGTLPRADKRKVAYWDDEAGEWRHDGQHYAVVNPAWLGDGLDADDAPNSAVWHVAKGRYTCVNPMDIYGPLSAAVRRYNASVDPDDPDAPDRPLGDVFGEVRQYRNGGEIHLDIVFGGLTVADPATDDDRYVLGLQTGTDHFGGRSTYARVVVFDTERGVAMRGLTRQRKRKHTGTAPKDVSAWWSEVLATLETAGDTIVGIISTARAYEIDFADLPFSVEEFYSHLGFPEGLSRDAAKRFGRPYPTTNAFTLYLAMAKTLTDEYEAKDEGSAFTEKVALTNRILWEPPQAEAIVLEAAETALRGQDSLTTSDAAVADELAARRDHITDDIDRFTATRKRLTTILEDAESVAEGEA